MTINFGPLATNAIDLIGKQLIRRNGDIVAITMSGGEFVVSINGKPAFRTADNLQVSAILNNLEVEAK
jgi:hypothetical protein